jgi:hypothetical protein
MASAPATAQRRPAARNLLLLAPVVRICLLRWRGRAHSAVLDWKYDFDSPDLPSGLKDLACAPSSTPTAAKMRGMSNSAFVSSSCSLNPVDGLLNPCECGDTCDCGPRESSTLAAPPLNLGTGLAVLAQAAALMNDGPIPPPKAPPKKAGKRGREGSASPTIRPRQVKRNKQVPAAIATPPTKSSCCSSKAVHSAQVPVLPPLSLFPELAPAGSTPKIMLPPITALELPPLASSLIPAATASGCCCGFQCSCPGCVEHRGQTHADPEHGDCKSSDCATCVDHEGGAGILGPSSTSFSVPAPSATVLDALFARRPSVRP